GSPEPLWNAVLALLAGGRPERVPAAYDALTPLVLLAVAVATYAWIRREGGPEESWAAVVVAFAVLGLTSVAMNPRPPVTSFWFANFRYKPNHGFAYALIAGVIGCWMARDRPWPLALVLSALAWVFLLGWAYALAGLMATVVLSRGERHWRRTIAAVAIS